MWIFCINSPINFYFWRFYTFCYFWFYNRIIWTFLLWLCYFKFLRRVVLLSFIIFEIIAQSLLVINFYKLKDKIFIYFNLKVLKMKMMLVSILVFVAVVSIPFLIKSGNVHFKHGLEWNYFIGVILFYLFTRFFWRRTT